jgi:hypothetical protein
MSLLLEIAINFQEETDRWSAGREVANVQPDGRRGFVLHFGEGESKKVSDNMIETRLRRRTDAIATGWYDVIATSGCRAVA